MPSSSAAVTPIGAADPWMPQSRHVQAFGFGDRSVKQVEDLERRGTLVIGIDSSLFPKMSALDKVFTAWSVTTRDGTTIADEKTRHVADTFLTPPLRMGRMSRRYLNAAEELKALLHPEIPMASIAGMCGVTDRGFYDWLKGKGIRERRSRRLMTAKAIVKALTLTRGRDWTIQWLQLPNEQLGGATPADALKNDEGSRVLELSVWRTPRPRQPGSVIPFADNQGEFSTEQIIAERGELDRVEIYDIL